MQKLNQDYVINKILDLRQDNQLAEFESVMIGGSIGRNEEDEVSDIDLFLLCAENPASSVLESKVLWLADAIGEVKLFSGPILVPDFGHMYTVIYHQLFMCQFCLNDRTTLKPNPMNRFNATFLYDDTNYYTNYLEKNRNIQVDSEKVFLKALHRFWIRLMGVIKEGNRNNIWLGTRFLTEAREQLIIMKRIESNVYPPGINFHKASKSLEADFAEWAKLLLPTLNDYNYNSLTDGMVASGQIALDVLKSYLKDNPQLAIHFINSLSVFELVKLKIRTV